jgi:hypothetical protein
MIRIPLPLAIIAWCAALSGCGDNATTNRTPTDISATELIAAKAEHDAAQRDADRRATEIRQLTERIAQAQQARETAIVTADRLAQLQAEKDELAASAALAGIQAREAKQRENAALDAIADKEKAIVAERTAEAQEHIYWFAGICGLAALIAAGIAIWLPLTRRWTGGFAVACAAVASLAVFVAWLLPYLWWIGCLLLIIGVIAAVVWWINDHKTAVQVVQAIETIKAQIPDYKTHFRQEIDSGVDTWIDRIRAKLNREKQTP